MNSIVRSIGILIVAALCSSGLATEPTTNLSLASGGTRTTKALVHISGRSGGIDNTTEWRAPAGSTIVAFRALPPYPKDFQWAIEQFGDHKLLIHHNANGVPHDYGAVMILEVILRSN